MRDKISVIFFENAVNVERYNELLFFYKGRYEIFNLSDACINPYSLYN